MKQIAKTIVNGLTISTVNLAKGKYETLVYDADWNELKCKTATCKKEAEHMHAICVFHYADKRNCIHLV